MRLRPALGVVVALLWALALAGCNSKLYPVLGSTARVSTPVQAENTQLKIDIFTDLDDCAGSGVVDARDEIRCLPYVDRRHDQVRLAFQVQTLDGDNFPLPLTAESKSRLLVAHRGTGVSDANQGQRYTIVPHNPKPIDQLFILVIDASASMNNDNRMTKVRNALLRDDVIDAFFPTAEDPSEKVQTGVVLLTFTEGQPRPVGGKLEIIEGRRQYKRLVSEQLAASYGYTHLYDAIQYATSDLLEVESIQSFISQWTAAVTVVALTDGFNNLQSRDICGDNAERLETLLNHLDAVRNQADTDVRTRPQVFTVGLGQKIRPGFEPGEEVPGQIFPRTLCGKYVNERIDGDLENRGIDNVSLSYVAAKGGGQSYVRRNSKELGDAFRSAAERRYEWFEVRYQVGFNQLRRSFESRLTLQGMVAATTTVDVHPSAWLDAPSGTLDEDEWAQPVSYAHTAVVGIPLLSLLIAISYLNATWFNTSRAVFRGTRSGKGDNSGRKPAAPSGDPPQTGPEA